MNEYLTSNEQISYPFKDDAVGLSASGVTIPVGTQVVAAQVFYDNSSWDAASDDDAIAPDKIPLLPGGTGSFVNVTSYDKGINGLMVDVANLCAGAQATDFSFKVGNDNSPDAWPDAPAPSSVSVRAGEGVGGSCRIVVTWADGVIVDTWLRVKLLASGDLGLLSDHTFYFGNLVGETGNVDDPLEVTQADEDDTTANQTGFVETTLDDPYDFNRDKRVTTADALISRDNAGSSLNAIDAPTIQIEEPGPLPVDFFLSAVTSYYGAEQLYLKSISREGSSFSLQVGTESEVLVTGELPYIPSTRQVIGFRNVVEGVTFRAVAGPGMAPYLGGLACCGIYEFGTSLPFATAAHDTKPNKLVTLGYELPEFDDLVTLQEGYNVSMEFDETTNELTLNASGGSGKGRYDPCSDPIPIAYLASISGKRTSDEAGSFVLSGDPCYRIIPGNGSVQLINDCTPCCTCDDYVAFGALYQGILEELQTLWLDLKALAEVYNADVETYNELLEEMKRPRLYGSASVGKNEHNDGHVNITATLHNPAERRLLGLDITPPVGWLEEDFFISCENNADGAILEENGQIVVEANGTIVATLLIVVDPDYEGIPGTTAFASGGGASIEIKWGD